MNAHSYSLRLHDSNFNAWRTLLVGALDRELRYLAVVQVRNAPSPSSGIATNHAGLSFKQAFQPHRRQSDLTFPDEAFNTRRPNSAKPVVPLACIRNIFPRSVDRRREKANRVAVCHPVTVPYRFKVRVFKQFTRELRDQGHNLIEFSVEGVIDSVLAARRPGSVIVIPALAASSAHCFKDFFGPTCLMTLSKNASFGVPALGTED